MRRLATTLATQGISVRTWEDVYQAGFVWDAVADGIASADWLLAEATTANPNVFFEIGYALALGKQVLLLVDSTQNTTRVKLTEPLTTLLYASVTEAVTRLQSVATPARMPLETALSAHQAAPGSLYYLAPQHGGAAAETILAICRKGFVGTVQTVEPGEFDYHRLSAQASAIASASVFVTALVSQHTRTQGEINAHVMTLAGLAAGFGREFLVLAEQPQRPLLDLGDRVVEFSSSRDLEPALREWLERTGRQLFREPSPPRTVSPDKNSPLRGLFMGHLDARVDPSLGQYFLETPTFHQAEAAHRQLFVGHKGDGKTAILRMLVELFMHRNAVVVEIAPLDFELPRLAGVFEPHKDDVRWEFAYGSFWRFILITEILSRIKDERMTTLLQRTEQAFARSLIDWIDENNEILGMDFVSRVSFVMNGLAASETEEDLNSVLQTSRLYGLEANIREFARLHEIRLFIDDLDRNFDSKSESARRLVVALFDVLPDLHRRLGQDFKPALFVRSDVYAALVNYDPEISRRDPGAIAWESESLELAIAKRIAAHLDSDETDPGVLWDEVFPRFVGPERSSAYVLTRTHSRPRDVIQFCQAAVERAQRAGRYTRVAEEDLIEAWLDAGERMLLQTEAEYQHKYPQISTLAFDTFFGGSVTSLWSDVVPKLIERATAVDPQPPWFEFALRDPRLFAEALFETGVVGVETGVGSVRYASHSSNREMAANLPDDFIVWVHPAYQRYFDVAASRDS